MNFLDYLKIFPNSFPNSISRALLELPRQGFSSVVSSSTSTNKINDEYRITTNIPITDEISQYIMKGLYSFWETHLRKYYNTSIINIESPQFLHYNVGGKYDVHNDSEDFVDGNLKRLYPRDVTILAYLNDDYEGGELEFPDFGLSIKPKTNMVIAFPSYYEYQHKVKPVAKGERLTLALWIETERRIYDRPYEMESNK